MGRYEEILKEALEGRDPEHDVQALSQTVEKTASSKELLEKLAAIEADIEAEMGLTDEGPPMAEALAKTAAILSGMQMKAREIAMTNSIGGRDGKASGT